MHCQFGCFVVEKIICDEVENSVDTRSEIIDAKYDQLKKYKCFQDVEDGEYGHMNYAVIAYAVKHEHIDCPKKIHTELDSMWQSDLAIVATVSDRLDCLKYIMENMGDVFCGEHILNYDGSLKCKNYIRDVCSNCNKNMHSLI